MRPRSVSLESWVTGEIVTLVGNGLDGLTGEPERTAVARRIDEANPQMLSTDREELITAVHTFVSTMNVEDLVAVPTETGLQVGSVTGPARPHTDSAGLAREVDWVGLVPEERQLPAEVAAALDQQGTVIDLGESADAIEELIEALAERPEQSPAPVPETVESRISLPAVTPRVAGRLHMGVAPLQEIVDILGRRRQLILYGPPGTGKTYLAQHLGRHLVGAAWQNHLQLVQFHPSYAYEDFFEGFRPALSADGQTTFSLTPGPLARIAAEARANPGMPFVLVIDEINRANLAKVFGELYFLLEYRDQTIRLQYRSQDTFRLPSNLYLIGTMNTADRSIAMIDAAMRRRFAFVELHPQEDPVKGVLERFVGDATDDERPRLLELLNVAIGDEDRDLHVGPTYLMRPEAVTDEGLRQIWRFDILPLLEEHYYGRLTRAEVHRRFGLEALRQNAAGTEPPAPETG